LTGKKHRFRSGAFFLFVPFDKGVKLMKNFLPFTRILALPALVLVLSVFAIALPDRPAVAQQVLDYHVYLPIVMRSAGSTQITPTPTATATATLTPTPTPTPQPTAIPGAYGIAADADLSAQDFAVIAQSGAEQTRLDQELRWSDVEAVQGQYDWNALADLETQMQAASANNLPAIVTIASSPAWAVPSGDCGPVLGDALPSFAAFMQNVVQRYSIPPYNIHTWELWNEPDVDGSAGCWGISGDYYSGYGGVYYAAMLQAAYPVIKAADPNATVLVGGLRLECDPDNAPGTRDCTMADFFEGILAGGGGPYFDGVSFHAPDGFNIYPTNWDLAYAYADPGWHAAWNTTGPVVQIKAAFIRNLLEQYGAGNKLLLNSQTAIPCASCTGFPEYENAKTAYVVQSFAAAQASSVNANIWHTWSGWQNTGLVDSSGAPLPALQAFQFVHQKLGNAAYVGQVLPSDINGLADVQGFKFDLGGQALWVLWYASSAEAQHTLSFSVNPSQAWNMTGGSLDPSNLVVSMNPIYILWP